MMYCTAAFQTQSTSFYLQHSFLAVFSFRASGSSIYLLSISSLLTLPFLFLFQSFLASLRKTHFSLYGEPSSLSQPGTLLPGFASSSTQSHSGTKRRRLLCGRARVITPSCTPPAFFSRPLTHPRLCNASIFPLFRLFLLPCTPKPSFCAGFSSSLQNAVCKHF